MNAYYCDTFVLPLPANHRFPMSKYALLRQRVLSLGLVKPSALRVPPAASDEQLLRAHCRDYIERVTTGTLAPAEVRRIGFPWSLEMVERSRRSTGATLAACEAALSDGAAANLAGGTHHATRDAGMGFCVFNDAAVSLRDLQARGRIRRAVVLDLDVHQGNGTADIFMDDDSVFTLSVHGEKNFPFRKSSSDLDIALPDGADDDLFLEAVNRGVRYALERAAADLAVYVAGADPYEGDRLGKLAATQVGLATRDAIVFDLCGRIGLPVAVVMGGGYCPNIEETVEIHTQTIAAAVAYADRWSRASGAA